MLRSDLKDLTSLRTGKVRDLYDLGDLVLLVATDRISAFDVVLPTPIPDKGKVLNQLSAFWFRRFEDLVANHLVTTDTREYPSELQAYRDRLAGRSMLVRKAEPLAVECVVRGYLAGSAWKDYTRTGTVCGIALPPGLVQSARLPEPVFTPSTKAQTGHDENISFERMAELIGRDLAEQVRTVSLGIYAGASAHAERQGVIIADTKFEFGLFEGRLVWIDEALTPDSSRFWPVSDYRPGGAPPSFDKQPVRDYLERIGWNKMPPAPELPVEVVAGTTARYREAFRRLTGAELGQ